jgi:HTH-type transcriptional regulator/antitoxin HipB
MKNNKRKMTSLTEHLDQQYGKRGSKKREIFEQEFEAFRLGVMIQELRKEKGLTQEALANKCGTTKTYISRIENNASDIRLSTLVRIIKEGLGGSLQLRVSSGF